MIGVDKNLQRFVYENETKPLKFYFLSIFSFLVLIINEFQFYYSLINLDVIACKKDYEIVPINSTTSSSYSSSYSPLSSLNNNSTKYNYFNESIYTFQSCIINNVPKCISEKYLNNSINETLSFSVPLFNFDTSIRKLNSSSLILSMFIFLVIVFIFFWNQHKNYIFKNRAHLLLSMNIITIDNTSFKKEFIGLIILVLFYSYEKYSAILTFDSVASDLLCNDVLMNLEFQDKFPSVISSIMNFALFLFFFKDPLLDYYSSKKYYYDEFKLIDLLNSSIQFNENQLTIQLLEKLKSIKITNRQTIELAMKDYVSENYQNETWSSQKKRIKIFNYWKSKRSDIITAVSNYQSVFNDKFFSIDDTLIQDLFKNNNNQNKLQSKLNNLKLKLNNSLNKYEFINNKSSINNDNQI